MSLTEFVKSIEEKISRLSEAEEGDELRGFRERRDALLRTELAALAERDRRRLEDEFDGWGPLTSCLDDLDVTEILVNAPDSIWQEKRGVLRKTEHDFVSAENCRRMIERVCAESGVHPTLERPSTDGKWRDFRLHLSGPPLSKGGAVLSLRRHPQNPWTLKRLENAGWCTTAQAELLRDLVRKKWNFLVVGATSSGKTSVVNALLAETSERAVVLEDSDEIRIPDGPSIKLLTRSDSQGLLPDVTLTDLLRQSLRLRPDRLVVGEVRGGEAKDLLLALSTGHGGSFGTLHADGAAQALLRLEMLVQMGAPEWGLETVRRLIRLSLQGLVVVGRNERGERKFKGLHRIVSLEESGFLLEPAETISP